MLDIYIYKYNEEKRIDAWYTIVFTDISWLNTSPLRTYCILVLNYDITIRLLHENIEYFMSKTDDNIIIISDYYRSILFIAILDYCRTITIMIIENIGTYNKRNDGTTKASMYCT